MTTADFVSLIIVTRNFYGKNWDHCMRNSPIYQQKAQINVLIVNQCTFLDEKGDFFFILSTFFTQKNSLTAYKIMFFKKIIIKSFTYNLNIHIAIKIINAIMMRGIICSFQADTSLLPKINT